MSIKTQKILILIAVCLLAFAVIAGVFLIVSPLLPEKEEALTTETKDGDYNFYEDGELSYTQHYKDGVFTGQTTYYTDPTTNAEYIMEYNADMEQTASKITEYNSVHNVTLITEKKNGNVVSTVEYTYFDDLTTLKKSITTEIDGEGNEKAEKLLYDEDGNICEKFNYENGEEVSHETLHKD